MKVPFSTAAAGPLVDCPGADHHDVALVLQIQDSAGGDPRPGQLRSDEGATNAVEQQVFGALDDVLRYVVAALGPATQVASLPVGPSGSVAAVGCTAVIVGPPSVLYACYTVITNPDRSGKGV